ncbi:hypothetical protein KAW80_03075 [Candidatus Babeliales bacterium]|nr:hypothetical protein [Candidatus Babeliales bacterium]
MDVQFYDIYDFYFVPFWKTWWFFALSLTIIFILLSFVIYKLIFLFKKTKPLSIWIDAEMRLNKIDPRLLMEKEEFKKFYFELGKILKQYLSKLFELDLENKTDAEIRRYLEEKKFDFNLTNDLVEILHGSRFIKFANETALPSKAREDWELALTIIKRTIPVENNEHPK